MVKEIKFKVEVSSEEEVPETVLETVPDDHTEQGEKEVKIEEEAGEIAKTEEIDNKSAIDAIFSNKEPDTPEKIEVPSETLSVPGEVKKEKKSTFKIILLFFAGLALGGLICAGIFFFIVKPVRLRNQKNANEISPSPVAEVTQEPSPELEPVDYSKYKAQVLNGSGVTGAAAGVKTLIEDLGFDTIDTGNATSSGFTSTLVQVKKEVPEAVFEDIKSKLVDYEVTKGDSLPETDEFTVTIIVGTKKD